MPDPIDLPESFRGMEARHATVSHVLGGMTWRVLDTADVDSPRDQCPIVMLPGALGSHKIFYRQWEFFQCPAIGRRLVLVDYPGSSDAKAMADGFDQLMSRLHVERALFVGSSLGACWLQLLTSSQAHPLTSRVAHLLIGNTFVDAEPLQKSPLFARSLVNDRPAAEVKNVFHGFVTGMPECELRTVQLTLMSEQPAEELANRLKMVANAGAIATSAVPQDRMSILSCVDDGVTTAEIAEQLRTTYPRAKHVVFPSGGHYPHVNQHAQYNKLLAEILGEH